VSPKVVDKVREGEELAAVSQEPRKWGESGEELYLWMVFSFSLD